MGSPKKNKTPIREASKKVEASPQPAADPIMKILPIGVPDSQCRIIDSVKLGQNVMIRAFTNLYGCEIGDGTQIGTFVEIQKGAKIGKNCKISSHTFICEGVTIGDNVFIGHGVMFTNDKKPKVDDPTWKPIPTVIKDNVSIGSGAVILPGITIDEDSIIGAGATVVKNVAKHAIVASERAHVIGWNVDG